MKLTANLYIKIGKYVDYIVSVLRFELLLLQVALLVTTLVFCAVDKEFLCNFIKC